MRPLVTVCLPTFRRPQWLRQSLLSVLAQRGVDVHLALLDNGSNCPQTDAIIAELLPKFGNPTFVRVAENNMANIGLLHQQIRGKYVVEHTDDDVMLPGNLAEKVKILEDDPDVGMAFSPVTAIDADGRSIRTMGTYRGAAAPTFDGLFATSRVCMPSAVMRASIFCPDWFYMGIGGEWCRHLSIASKAKIAYIAQPLVQLRLHQQSDTQQRGFGEWAFLDMHLAVWQHWLDSGFAPSKQTANDMYRIYCDLAWLKNGPNAGFAADIQRFVDIFHGAKIA